MGPGYEVPVPQRSTGSIRRCRANSPATPDGSSTTRNAKAFDQALPAGRPWCRRPSGGTRNAKAFDQALPVQGGRRQPHGLSARNAKASDQALPAQAWLAPATPKLSIRRCRRADRGAAVRLAGPATPKLSIRRCRLPEAPGRHPRLRQARNAKAFDQALPVIPLAKIANRTLPPDPQRQSFRSGVAGWRTEASAAPLEHPQRQSFRSGVAGICGTGHSPPRNGPQRSIGSIRRCWGPRRKAIVPSDLSGIQRAGVSREG